MLLQRRLQARALADLLLQRVDGARQAARGCLGQHLAAADDERDRALLRPRDGPQRGGHDGAQHRLVLRLALHVAGERRQDVRQRVGGLHALSMHPGQGQDQG